MEAGSIIALIAIICFYALFAALQGHDAEKGVPSTIEALPNEAKLSGFAVWQITIFRKSGNIHDVREVRGEARVAIESAIATCRRSGIYSLTVTDNNPDELEFYSTNQNGRGKSIGGFRIFALNEIIVPSATSAASKQQKSAFRPETRSTPLTLPITGQVEADKHSYHQAAKTLPIYQGWVPKGEVITIAGREIAGMVYVGTPPKIGTAFYGDACRAFIDPTLSVAQLGTDKTGNGVPYYPSYSAISPVCRATYLDWLADGRQDGAVSPGYMFLFFYGLERRFMIDQPSDDEKREIVAEVERLKSLFCDNYSVQRYLGEFLDVVRIADVGELDLDDPSLKKLVLQKRYWDLPFTLKFLIGGFIQKGIPLDADWLRIWLTCNPDTRLRTSATRCAPEFEALFKHIFDKAYPTGLKITKPRKALTGSYRAASGEFEGKLNPNLNGEPVPDISGLRKPIEIAQKIANEASAELDKFSRYLGRNPNGRGTIEAQALLPAGLRSLFPSKDLGKFKIWASECVSAGGFVSAAELISRLEGGKLEKFGKRQLTGVADALALIGFGMVPDPRISLRGAKIEEPVVIFELDEAVEELDDITPAYRMKLLELALASLVAHADNQLVEAERRALRGKVETANGLTEIERKYLYANLEWYLNAPPDMFTLRSKLKDVDAENQLVLRSAVVAIAHADGVIHSREVSIITDIYKSLGIDAGLVYADLHAGEVVDAPVRVKAAKEEAPGEKIPGEQKVNTAVLDAARIAAIRNDTERVSSVLGEIFSGDDDAGHEAAEAHLLPSSLAGLDPKYAMLVEQIIQREHWANEEFDEIARKQGLMPSGALEAINEWAFEKFDEALLDEYDGYEVSPDIANALRAEKEKGN